MPGDEVKALEQILTAGFEDVETMLEVQHVLKQVREEHAMEVDWDKYDADAMTGMSRQLLRAKHDVTPDAFAQLEEAFIFHTRYAWETLKWQVKSMLLVRCSLCKHRHWFKPYVRHTEGGGGVHCGYGIWYTFRSTFRAVWFAGRHGED